MFGARRVYVYVVSLVSFAAVVFSAISLLQEMLAFGSTSGSMDIALQIAVLIIAAPIYLGHWAWQQGAVKNNEDERGALERRLYLYAVLGGAAAIASINIFNLLKWALDVGYIEGRLRDLPAWKSVLYYLIPVAISAGVWLYHNRLLRFDRMSFPDTGMLGTVHRIYLYLFSTAGLTLVALATGELIRWLLSILGDSLFSLGTLAVDATAAIPQALVGLTLWLAYWTGAQRLFRTGSAEETGSVLRKFYLYAAILVGVAGGVSAAALILAGIFRAMLGLSPSGDIRNPIAWIFVFVLLWFYHSRVLDEDVHAAEQTAQQNEVRRIYLYLLAAVGLIALLVGAIGDISTLLFIVEDGISDAHRESLAYFSAALIAGLPVWLLAWRSAQREARRTDRTGGQARASGVRRIYLYFFLLASMLSALGSAIFVLYRVLEWLLAGESLTLVDIAIPLTIAVVQAAVWMLHVSVLRSDRRMSAQVEERRLADLRLALVDHWESASLLAVVNRLRNAAPGVDIRVLRSGEQMTADDLQAALTQIEQAEVIVAPWTLFVDNGRVAESSLAAAVARSEAQKIVLPQSGGEWRWVGLDVVDADEAADETLRLLRAIVAGEEVGARKRFTFGTVALTLVGAVILLVVLSNLLGALFRAF